MSTINTLLKLNDVVVVDPGEPSVPPVAPKPAYCIDVTTYTPGYRTTYITDEQGVVHIIQTSTGQMVPVVTRTCYPAEPGSPGSPGRPPNFYINHNIGWDGSAISIASLTGDGVYKFSVPRSVVGVVTGLNDAATDSSSYLDIDFGFTFASGGYRVIENGTIKTSTATYVDSDVFAISRVGGVVRYYKNSTLVYTSANTSSGVINADASLYMGGDKITDASLTTLSSADYGNSPFAPTNRTTGILNGLRGFGSNVSNWHGTGPSGPLDPSTVDGNGDWPTRSGGQLRNLVGVARGGDIGIAGVLGGLRGYAANVAYVQVLGELTGLSASAVVGGVGGAGDTQFVQGVLGGLRGESYSGLTGGVCAGVLNGLEGNGQSGLLMPDFAIIDGVLTPLAGFGVALAGMTGTCQGVLQGLRGFASNVANWAGTGPTYPIGTLDEFGDWPGRSGGQLRGLVGFSFDQALVDAQYWGGHATLPMLVVHATLSGGTYGRLTAAGTLPMLRNDWRFGWPFTVTLPMLTVTSAITIPISFDVDVTLPMLTSEASGNTGTIMSIAVTLPMPTTAGMLGGWTFTATLPELETSATILGGGSAGTFAGILPRLVVAASFSAPVGGLRAFVVLPALAAAQSLTAAILLPRLRAYARLSPVYGDDPGSGETAAPARQGWATNLSNSATTQFTSYEFRAFARAFNEHYAIGLDDGLFQIGGDADDNEPIDWAWESGLADFGVNSQKGLLALYVDGLFANTATFTVQGDVARRIYGHKAKGNIYNHQPHRIPLGKGVRTRNIGIGMADAKGGYLELDKITPEYVITSRNL